MGELKLSCAVVWFYQNKSFNAKKEKKKKSSMFQEDLFTVVVLQRPCSKQSICYSVGTGWAGCKPLLEISCFVFCFLKNYKDFICKLNCFTCSFPPPPPEKNNWFVFNCTCKIESKLDSLLVLRFSGLMDLRNIFENLIGPSIRTLKVTNISWRNAQQNWSRKRSLDDPCDLWGES